MIGEGECGAIGGIKIGRGNRNTRRKPAPAPLCPPQIPLEQTRDRTRAAAVKPAINRLSCGAALSIPYLQLSVLYKYFFSYERCFIRSKPAILYFGTSCALASQHEGSDYNADPTERVLAALTPSTCTLIGHVTMLVARHVKDELERIWKEVVAG
jgi:hypothetical protein